MSPPTQAGFLARLCIKLQLSVHALLRVFPYLWYTAHCVLELSGAIHALLLSYLRTTLKMSSASLMKAKVFSPMSKNEV